MPTIVDQPRSLQTTSTSTIPLSVIVLAYNEEPNLVDCLSSFVGRVGEIFVVDSGSTDGTVEIAKSYGATVVHHPFTTHASQWKWALDNLALRHEWVLGLDADQRMTPELAVELRNLLPGDDAVPSSEGGGVERVHGYDIKRRQVFRGQWIRHGGYYPRYMLKLFRRDRVRMDLNDLVDHHFYVDGPVGRLKNDIIEENKKEDDITFWVDKHNRYAGLLAEEEFRRHRTRADSLTPSIADESSWQKRIWYRLPLYVRPLLYFCYRYFLRLGFLDRKEGFVFHFLQGFWFRLLVDIKLDELMRNGIRARS